jgi:superfamily II DNA or RNA helicase
MGVVKIKKIRTNFKVRSFYDENLIKYIKKIPSDQLKTSFDTIVVNGQAKKDWFHICNAHGLMKILWYCHENNVQYVYENISEKDIYKIEAYTKKKKEQIENVRKFKETDIDVSKDDYSFMKIQPYPYQKKAVRFFELCNGVAILGDQPGVGKSLEFNELVATNKGWVRIADIKIGDKVFNHDGLAYPVTGVFPQGKLDSYKVTFNDDFTIECSIDHLWMVRDVNERKKNKVWVVKTLKELIENGLHYKNRSKSNGQPVLKWEIPTTQPIQYPKKQYIIPPYILGVLIGNGCLVGRPLMISTPDNQFETDSFLSKIDKLNVKSGQKFIPKNYLTGSIEQRIDLLQGLMDIDGSANKNKINYHTTSKQLAKDIAELVQSLGGQAIIKHYSCKRKNKSDEWCVNIRINICPFKLKQKKEQWWPAKRNYASRYIKSVEYVGKKEHQCISVDSPDNTFVAKNYIVTHNTLSAISYSIKYKFKTIIVCPASMVLVWAKEILKFTNEKPFVFKYKISKKEKLDLAINSEESNIHIVSYNALDTYLKFDVHHKCQNPYCDFEETSQIKKYKLCPKCFKEKSIKSKNTDLSTFVDKKGHDLKVGLYDLVVMDEAHYIKNPKAQRTKLVTKAFKSISKKILLSGTAIKSKPYEFFVLLNFLEPFEWVNAHAYGVKYCNGKQDEYGHWNYDGYSNIDELVERLNPLYLRRKKSDPGVLEHLPPKTFTIIPIYLSPEEQSEYKKLESGVLDEMNPEDDKMTHLQKIQKLKFFTAKICAERAYEFIQNIIDGDEKIVVFSQYIETTRMIYERFKENAVWYTGKHTAEQKEEAREAFMNDENIKVFSGTFGAAGVGLTLTSSSTVLSLDQPWTPSDREQAEDRVHRASQTSDKVQVLRLICQGTIDEDIENLLNEKEKVTLQVLDGEYIQKDVKYSVFDDIVNIILNKRKNIKNEK